MIDSAEDPRIMGLTAASNIRLCSDLLHKMKNLQRL